MGINKKNKIRDDKKKRVDTRRRAIVPDSKTVAEIKHILPEKCTTKSDFLAKPGYFFMARGSAPVNWL